MDVDWHAQYFLHFLGFAWTSSQCTKMLHSWQYPCAFTLPPLDSTYSLTNILYYYFLILMFYALALNHLIHLCCCFLGSMDMLTRIPLFFSTTYNPIVHCVYPSLGFSSPFLCPLCQIINIVLWLRQPTSVWKKNNFHMDITLNGAF